MLKSALLDPLISVLFLLWLALASMVGPIPEYHALMVIVAFFSVLVFLHPMNGVYFLLIMVPFFLGDSKRPYFSAIEVFVYLTLLSGLIHYLRGEKKPVLIPFRWAILLFVLSGLMSMPLNLKELYYEVKGRPWIEVWKILKISHEGFNLYYVRSLLNNLSAVGLYLVCVYFIRDADELISLFKPLCIIFTLVVFFAYVLRLELIPHPDSYLGMSLVGRYPFGPGQIGISGFAYNTGYLGQYLVMTFPFLFFYVFSWKDHRWMALLCLVFFIIGLMTIPFTYQRGPVIAFVFEALILVSFLARGVLSSGSKNRLSFSIKVISTVGGMFAGLFCADYFLFHGIGMKRLAAMTQGLGPRGQIWKVAWEMFKSHPVLGIGVGKFHLAFPQYCEPAGIVWAGYIRYIRTTAHNVYLHLLAEQGLLGLLSFMTLIFLFFRAGWDHYISFTRERRLIVLTVLLALSGWLAYGLTQTLFYLRVMQIFFWLMLGFLAVLLKPHLQERPLNRKWIFSGGVLFVFLFLYRFFMILKWKG
ncbi:MAG: O-antigen ligase family protein [Candidatus Aureabacteria bacterium]|nr:O-antigen ligase family protein [Candidatus Auribacterota bacterium]